MENIKIEICEICQKGNEDLYECEKCSQIICSNCQDEYNQFTQIDYNCCKPCAKYSGE